MKKIITLLLAALISFNLQSQTTEYDSLIMQVHQFYDELDHSDMQTNYLFNKGFVVLNQLEEWKDGYPIITNIERWKYIFQSIELSDITGSTNFPAFETLTSDNDINSTGISTIGLSFLNYEGDYLTASHIEQMAQNNIAPNFMKLNLFAGTVLHHISYNQTVNFKWNPQSYFTNLNQNVTIEIDLGDNLGFRDFNISQFQTITTTYDCIGEKNIMFRCVSNNDTLISFSKLTVLSLQATIPTKEGEIVVGDSIANGQIQLKSSDPNVYLRKGNYKYYEGYDNKLNKPVIIAEGFDILGTETAQDYYNYWSSTIERLRNHGYDVFTLNFRAPNRDLETNAEIVIKLIKGINDDKEGKYEGIYIGESMGGVIGRIALKKMENDNYDHQIGLYVPYDSPFKGANVPLGIQWMFRDAYWSLGPTVITGTFFVELFEWISGADVPVVDLYQQLTSTAAKQLFVRHFKGNSDYNSFQTYLSNLGYPAESRNVTFINGCNSGQTQGITLGGKIFQKKLILGVFNINAQCWYSNVNVTDQTVSKLLYISIYSAPWNWKIKNRKESFNSQAFDNAPGGRISYSVGSDNIKFCFVPSLSSIDINSSRYTGNLDYYNSNENTIINNNESPFDDIYSSYSNSSHVALQVGGYWNDNLEKQEIMYDDMYLQNRTIDKDRDFEAEHNITVGNDVQPSSFDKNIETGDFVVKSGTTVKMEAGNSIILLPGFKAEAGSYFTASITPNPTLKRGQVANMNDNTPPQIIGSKYICNETTYKVFENKESISWALKGHEVEINQLGNEFLISQQLKAGQYTLYCSNGTTSSSKIVVVSSDEQCHLFKQLENNFSELSNNKSLVFPNPTSGVFTIRTEQSETKQFVTVSNALGKDILKQQKLKNRSMQIDISNSPSGIYFVEIQTGNNIETHKIIKE